MAVRDRHIDRDARVARETITIPLVTAVSQTDVVAHSFTPGFPFEVVAVSTYNSNKAGAVAGVLKVGGRTAVAAVSFTDETEVEQTVTDTVANRRGSAAEAITLEYTSDGSGALTNGSVSVTIRPLGLRGEIDG